MNNISFEKVQAGVYSLTHNDKDLHYEIDIDKLTSKKWEVNITVLRVNGKRCKRSRTFIDKTFSSASKEAIFVLNKVISEVNRNQQKKRIAAKAKPKVKKFVGTPSKPAFKGRSMSFFEPKRQRKKEYICPRHLNELNSDHKQIKRIFRDDSSSKCVVAKKGHYFRVKKPMGGFIHLTSIPLSELDNTRRVEVLCETDTTVKVIGYISTWGDLC